MGLGDMYGSEQAQSIATNGRDSQANAFGSLPGLYSQKLQQDQMEQSNADQKYNNPSRSATHTENAIGDYVKKHLHGETPPGHAPGEAQARLQQELSQPQNLAGAGQSMMGAGAKGAMAGVAPQPEGPSLASAFPNRNMQAPPSLSYAPQMPGAGDLSTQFNNMTGLGGRLPTMDTGKRGMESMAPARGPQSPNLQPEPPMTHGDVGELMKMAPWMKADKAGSARDYIGEENNKETNRETLAGKKGGIKQGLQAESEKAKKEIADDANKLKAKIEWQKHLDKLEEIKARIKIGTGTAMDIAILKSMTQMYESDQSSEAKVGGIPAVVDPEAAKSQKRFRDEAKQALIDLTKQQQEMQSKGPEQSVEATSSSRQPQGPKAQAALAQAKNNPSDPRSQKVFKILGLDANGN